MQRQRREISSQRERQAADTVCPCLRRSLALVWQVSPDCSNLVRPSLETSLKSSTMRWAWNTGLCILSQSRL